MLQESGLLDRDLDLGEIVESAEVGQVDRGAMDLLPQGSAAVLHHRRIPFVSYPYEWPFEMLRDAARLQLDLMLAALSEGLVLKDATPFNVQWRGVRPVFVDIGSFEPYEEGQPWLGYRQFCMQFLYPLMLRAYRDVTFHQVLRGSPDGLSPGDFNRLLSFRDRFRRGVLKHVWLHARLEKSQAAAGGEVRGELKRAGFNAELVRANVRSLRKLVDKVSWTSESTVWTSYSKVNEYRSVDVAAKREFVERAASDRRWGLVWDLGCNDGSYTRIAAEHADYALAIDGDETLINTLFEDLRERESERILPLVLDLTNPSPNLGWRGAERSSLEGRGKPDLVLALALVHHLAIAGSIPPESILAWLRSLDACVVVEFVTLEDPMAALLASRKQGDIHPGYDRVRFEESLGREFDVAERLEICDGRRILYFAKPRP